MAFIGVIIITLVYLWLILFAAPKFMLKREPFKVTPLTCLYNIFQVIVCFLCVLRGSQLGFNFTNLFQCHHFESSFTKNERFEIFLGIWMFLGLRIFAFMETIFFILRKKFKQVTFLHIFHQIGYVFMILFFLISKAGKRKETLYRQIHEFHFL